MNGQISAITGQPVEAALWSFGSGLFLLTLALLLTPAVRRGLRAVRAALADGSLRWWECVGGLSGGLFVAAQAYAVPAVGVALFSVATVAGQTGNALVVDRLGIGPGGRRPVQAGRLGAAVLALVGVAIAVSPHLGRTGTGVALLPVLASLAVGGLVAMQLGINARVNLASGHVLTTTWLNFLTGSTLLVVLAAGQWLTGGFRPAQLSHIPLWAWWGGLCGVGVIAIAAWSVRHLGVLVFGLALLTGQLGSAVLLDLLDPARRPSVGPVVLAGVLVTLVAAALAGWAARRGARAAAGQIT